MVSELKRIDKEMRYDGEATLFRWWILLGEHGAVQIAFMKLPQILGHTRSEKYFPGGWTGNDVGYHQLSPKWEGQGAMPCDLFEGVSECYYSGSSLPAQDILMEWASSGYDDEIIWRAAELFYHARFIDNIEGTPSFEELMMFVMGLIAEDPDGE